MAFIYLNNLDEKNQTNPILFKIIKKNEKTFTNSLIKLLNPFYSIFNSTNSVVAFNFQAVYLEMNTG